MGAGVPLQSQFDPNAEQSIIPLFAVKECNEGEDSSTNCSSSRHRASTSALTSALTARSIDPCNNTFSSPSAEAAAVIAFDSFERQINNHHIRHNRQSSSSFASQSMGGFNSSKSTSSPLSLLDSNVNYCSTPPPSSISLKSRAKQGLDTPLKNQMHYYLSRHLSEGDNNNGNGKGKGNNGIASNASQRYRHQRPYDENFYA